MITSKNLKLLVLVGLLSLLFCPETWAAVETIESSVLRVEVTASPYSFRILERSTGEVLLSESSTAFTEKRYRATEATEFTRAPNTLGTTLSIEGSANKAHVTFSFLKPEVVRVLLAYGDDPDGEIFEEFDDQGEHYYGIWEYPFGGNIDNRGADHDFLGVQHEPDVNYSNARAPFYLTSRKYGLYVESAAQGHYVIANAGKTGFSFHDSPLKYDFIYGPSYPEILNRYNALAGPASMPPTWAFDSIWWRDDNHADLRDVSNAQERVINDADRLRAQRIPAGAIWLDRPYGTGQMGWGNMDFDSSFPDPAKMIRDLNDRGMALLLWIANRCWNMLYQEGSAKGYLFGGPGSAADLRRPEAYDWFKEKLDAYVRLGIKGYKIDRGEEAELPRSVENLNAILFPKLAAEGLEQRRGRDYFEFSRNANDVARKYTAVWNGDTQSTFGGLAVSIKNALRCGVINFRMWGSDTGGYIGVPSKELFARWLEFSAYSPMMDVLIGPRRTIWYDYDEELISITRTFVTEHHDLIPYTRSYLYQATQTGMPVLRPLVFAFPTDGKLYDTWDEYLFGDEILVAPVTVAGATRRDVYLPAARWISYQDRNTVYDGPTTVSVEAPLGTIPLFAREAAIIVRGDVVKTNNNWDEKWALKLRIEIFLSDKSSSQFNYFTGSSPKTITVSPTNAGTEVNLGDLGASGTVEVYCRSVVQVVRNGKTLQEPADYSYDALKQRLSIPFQGSSSTQLVITGARSLF